MKKTVVFISLMAFILTFTACGGIMLAEDQEMYTLNRDGSLDWQAMMEGEELASGIGFDYDDRADDMIDAVDRYLRAGGISAEVNSLKKVKGYILLDISFFKPEDMLAYDLTMTFGQFADDYYGGMGAMADSTYLYKDASRISPDDLDGYAEHKCLMVYDSCGSGSYFRVPGKIMIVHTESGYRKVDGSTIFIEGYGHGAVAYE